MAGGWGLRTKVGAAVTVLLLLALSSAGVSWQTTGGTSENHALRPQREIDYAVETERLYRLTCELKVELQKDSNDTLSVETVKKIREIERLLQRLNEDMKRNR